MTALNFKTLSEAYEQHLVGPIFRPWVDEIFDAVGLRSGNELLDVACGTGIVARLARARVGTEGRVVGVDASPAMLAVARSVEPSIDWREGNALALPLRDRETFDAVICQQGLQFFPDRPAAAREMHRALVPGGRVAAATWRPDDEFPLGRELRRIAERRVGPIADQRHAFGETAPLETLFRDAGFRDVRVRTLERTIRFDDGMVFVRLNAMALVGMSAAGKAMSEEERANAIDAVAQESSGALPPYTDSAGLAFRITTNLATANA